MNFKVLITLCFLLTAALTASAAADGGSVRGVVTDPFGAYVAATKITLKPKTRARRSTRTTISGKKGEFVFSGVPPGIYEVSATHAGGMSSRIDDFRVAADAPNKLDIRIEYGGDCPTAAKKPELTDREKASIVNKTLADALLKNKIALIDSLLKPGTPVVVSTENIEREWIRPVKKIEFQLLGKDEIRKLADARGEFLYLSFDELKTKGGCVTAAVSNLWAAPFKSANPPTTGGGNIYVYRRKLGKWKAKTVGRWSF